jgi:hypothetical protein
MPKNTAIVIAQTIRASRSGFEVEELNAPYGYYRLDVLKRLLASISEL